MNTNQTPPPDSLGSPSGYASSVPTIHITTIPNVPGIPDLHHLKGWDDLDRWGRWNHLNWAAIQCRTEWATGMSEIDKLRLLAGEMLRLNVELAERNLELIRVMPVPPIFIPSHNVQEHTTPTAPKP